MMKPINLKYDRVRYKAGDTKILYSNLGEGSQNLFVVSTPMQLLSAIEAQKYFKTKNNVLIILFFLIRDGKNINQMFKLSEYFPYDKLITFQNHKKNFLPFTRFLKEITSPFYQYVFFGYSTFMYRRMIANLKYKKLYFIDDGVHTLTTHKQVFNLDNKKLLKEFKPYPNVKLKHKLLRLGYKIKGYKIDIYLEDLNFFTLFNLTPYKNEEIIKHDFSHVRNLFYKEPIESQTVYILGQPLTRAIGLASLLYLDYIKGIFDSYKDRKIVFVPHRTESIDELLRELIDSYKNVSILEIDEPIELYFMYHNIYPKDIASFMTSALFNLKVIFPHADIKAFKIKLKSLSEFHQNNIQLIYDNYKKENINLVELSND